MRISSYALLFILLTVALNICGQILVKRGMLGIGASPSEFALLPKFVLNSLLNLQVLIGLTCSVLAAITWIVAVSRADLGAAYPFMALAIVLVVAISGVLFGEGIMPSQAIGVGIVCLGLVVATRGW